MIRVALRGLAGRKFRASLTAIAIVVGVAMVSGTYVLTDTIDKAFNAIFSESYAGTDAVVRGRTADISFQGITATAPPIPETLLDSVSALPEVDTAAGYVVDESQTKLLTKKGQPITTSGAPSFGWGIDPRQTRFNPFRLVVGRWPRNDDEVVIDAASAEKEDYAVGETIRIASAKPVRSFEIVGLAQYGDVKTLGTATFAVFTIPTAQVLLDRVGKFDGIAVAATDGVSPDEVVDAVRPVLPPTAHVRTGSQEADEQMEEVAFTQFIRYFLLAFAGIALFVGAFVIFNTLSITVAQRAREFATLRTIGASQRQILASVVLEALIVGTIASVIGLFGGLALARGLNALFVALNLDLPMTDLVFATRTVVVSLLVGIVVTLLAGLFPAIRATRVPPIAAVREGASLPPSRLAPLTPYIALVTVAIAVAVLGYAMLRDELATGRRFLAIGIGVVALFIGVALVSPRLVRPLARVLGWPATRFGGAAGLLAQGNSQRNPGRTAATAAALMIGVALVTFVAVLASGMKASNRGAIERQIRADYVVTSQDGFTPFVAGAAAALGGAERPELVTPVRAQIARVGDATNYVTGIDPRAIAQVYRFDWNTGSDAVLGQLGTNGAVVDDDFAEEHGIAVGDSVHVVSTSGRRATLQVKAVYEPPPFYPLLGAVSMPLATYDRLYEDERNQFVFVNVPGEPTNAAKEDLEKTVALYPDAKVQTREEWIASQDEDFNQFLSMLYILLALSVIVSIFGMVNTLVLSVFERTRELGVLRAVGMTRRQVRRMVRYESVITALIGAALGVPLGIFLAALVTRALAEFDVQFSLPESWLVVFAIVAVVVGVVAAIVPARRAARLRVLEALAYE